MATDVSSQDDTARIRIGNESDYGSDVDEAAVDALFSQRASWPALDGIEKAVILDDHDDTKPLLRLAKIRDNLSVAISDLGSTSHALRPKGPRREVSIEIEYDESDPPTFSPPPGEAAHQQRRKRERSVPIERDRPDTRSPLQRFRTPPKKCLSVTDIVSPAWCELQYWYSLTKYGRVRRTPAMKQGSSVHKGLEEQVHTEVPVDIVTKEDRFALRVWNVIQGLKTLRRTGMTRELEVWGVVEGEVVNGVIDQITMTCPDEEAEARMLEEAEGATTTTQTGANSSKKRKPLAPDQRTLGEYFANSTYGGTTLEQNGSAWLGTLQEERPAVKTLYIVDVKTRQSKSLPAHGSQTRPTHYQLMLYHRLFSTLAANGVDASRIFERYAVDPEARFSDTFIAQMSSLSMSFEDNDGVSAVDNDGWSVAEEGVGERSQDPIDLLLAHNTLTTLWSLMIQESSRTIPTPTSTATLSPLLTAEFRTSSSGALLGRRHFPFSPALLDTYVQDELRWWRGERETKGVEVEEAFKCGICEFVEGCEWRKEKVEGEIRKMRLRREGRGEGSRV